MPEYQVLAALAEVPRGRRRLMDVATRLGFSRSGTTSLADRLEGAGLRVTAGLPPAEAVVVEQRGCVFRPRMTGARVGQTLRVVSGDDTIHNVRSVSEAGSDFNVGQPIEGMEFDFELAAEETMTAITNGIKSTSRFRAVATAIGKNSTAAALAVIRLVKTIVTQ